MNKSLSGCQRACLSSVLLTTLALVATASDAADDDPQEAREIKHRIQGLCCREREDDLRAVVEKMQDVKLVRLDFDSAEAVFLYNPRKLFPHDRPERFTESFDNLLKSASTHTFWIRPTATAFAKDKLTLIAIPVIGLDCKGCCMGAYNAIDRIDGVERATACFKEGRVTALIDPEKTNRRALEDALKKAGVTLKSP